MPNILIELLKQKAAKNEKKTAAFPSRRRWRPGRRRGGKINFYDLCSISTGPGITQFTELDYQYPIPAFGTQAQYGNPSSGSSVYPDIAATDYNGLLAKIHEVPLEDWKTTYKKITPAMDYDININRTDIAGSPLEAAQVLSNDNPNFTDAGLTLPASYYGSDYIYLTESQLITQPFFIDDHPNNHITTEFDINADAVPFTPSKKMDVFLIPSLLFIGAQTQLSPGPVLYNEQHLNDYWIFWPRGYFVDPSHPLYDGSAAGFNYFNNERPPEGNFHSSSPYNVANYQKGRAFAEWLKTLPDARGIYREASSGFDPFSFTDDGSYFNTGVGASPDASTFYYSSYHVPANQNLVYLYGVVLQNGTFYYFWNAGWL